MYICGDSFLLRYFYPSLLHAGGEVAEAFTNAFVYVKVLEIRAQMEQCFNCTCTFDGPVCNLLPSANFSQCVPVIGACVCVCVCVHACL